MTIEDFDNKLDIMPSASLYELWKYHENVRAVFASDLAGFTESGARGIITGLPYIKLSSSKRAPIPSRTIRRFWEALVSVVHGSFEKVIVIDIRAALDIDPFTGGVSSISRAGT
jgi:hypothetical protein